MSKFSKLSIFAVVIAIAVGFAFSISPVQADSDMVQLRVSHRINGRALGLEKELLVDIYVNDGEFLSDVPFGTSGRFEVPAGEYEIEIYLAGTMNKVMGIGPVELEAGSKVDLTATLGSEGPILRAVIR